MRASRRPCGSPPYSQKIFASSSALEPFTSAAAVSDCRRSIRMSSGPACWKLKPRPASSSCGELTPKSSSTPSQLAGGTHSASSEKFPRRNSNRPANSARRSRAASMAAPSRSHPNNQPVGELAAKMAAACPAPPIVPSVTHPPGFGLSASSTSASITGL